MAMPWASNSRLRAAEHRLKQGGLARVVCLVDVGAAGQQYPQ